ncbi:hypothetical protein HPB49_022926 [Dermacentor silvarum]|uniref:Uncharacterized protein n=1 Tax=Dermacentor silvarum TaxID=543639 RepID=A0ACB8DR71_DERSI|nr:hypothetical protein HPB49_022926 [Dermacentor silvarum]
MSRPGAFRETQGSALSEAPLEKAFRRPDEPVGTRGNLDSLVSTVEEQPSVQPLSVKHASSAEIADAVSAAAATTSAVDLVISDQSSTQAVEIIPSDKYQRALLDPSVPSNAASPSLSGTRASALLPPGGIPRQSSGTRLPAKDSEGLHASARVTKTSNRTKPHGDVSEYSRLQTAASTSAASRPPESRSPSSWSPTSVSPDTSNSSVQCDNPTYADLTSGHSTKAEGRLAPEGNVIRHLAQPLSKAERSSGRSLREQKLKSRKLSSVRGMETSSVTPGEPGGRAKTRLIKAAQTTGDAHNKEKKEVVATPTGPWKASPSPPFPSQDQASKELLGQGTTAAASSQSVATLPSTSPEGSRDPALLLGENRRDHKKWQPEMVVNYGQPQKETQSPRSQAVNELRPSASVGGVQSVSSRTSGPGSAASPDKLLFDPHQSQLVLSVKPLSPKSGSTPRPAKARRRFQRMKKMSWPFTELRKFRLNSVNRSLDPCNDFSEYACSAWNPPWIRADYATSSDTQLIRAWFDGFGDLLMNASKHGFAVADGPAAMLRACLEHTTKAGVPGIQELRELMASVHLNWPDPPDDDASPLGVLLQLAYNFGVRTWFTVRVYWRDTSHISTVHLSPADTISFAVKHHRRVMTSKAYELLWQAFYGRFQEFGNGSSSPDDAAIESSAVMQTFILEHIFEAKTKATGGPACFVMAALDTYTANISSEEWVTEINKMIPGAHVSASGNISVSDLAVLEAIDAIFKSFTRRDIMDFLGWQMAQLYGPLVDPVLSNAYFGDGEHTATYLPHVCASQVEASYPGLPAALHYLTSLDRSARNAVKMTLESVASTTAALVEGVSWLDAATKAAATAKLRSAKVRLWPPSWILEKEALTRIYSHFPVNATSLVDFLKLSRRTIRKLIKSEPEFEEVLSSPLSGSLPYFSYDQALNEVSISAGAVQFPLFVPGGTPVMNYAGLGFSFALQFVRSLDSVSRTVSADGLCTKIDDGKFSSFTAALQQRSSCLAPAYNGSFFPEVVALEATHAAFVNTVGGAHDGERLVKEFSNEQTFYIALCYFQCGRQGGPRNFFNGCNKAVMHFPDFADAFRCPAGSRMYPSGSCRLF